MGTRQTHRQKREWLSKAFSSAKEKQISLSLSKVLSTFCIENECTRKTALELIKQYEKAGMIKIKEGEIFVK